MKNYPRRIITAVAIALGIAAAVAGPASAGVMGNHAQPKPISI